MSNRLFHRKESFEGLPVVLLLGRPNSGKSTLFNRLVGRRQNIVFDQPGVTRDFLDGHLVWEGRRFRVVDSAGFSPGTNTTYPGVEAGIREVLGEADLVVYLVDGTEDVNPVDREVLRDLQKKRKRFLLAINKIDSAKREAAAQVFYELGISPIYFISSEHNLGIDTLLDAVSGGVPALKEKEERSEGPDRPLNLAIVGRPNVGKSTLMNTLFGKHRATVSDEPGTTRDAILIEIEVDGKKYRIVDTAGIRRPGKRDGDLERLSVAQSIRGIKEADVVVFMIDAFASIVEQDKKVLGEILRVKKPFLVVFNKWDLVLAKNRKVRASEHEKAAKKILLYEFPFATYATLLFLSAKSGVGKAALFKAVNELHRESERRFGTSEVNDRLMPILNANPPPSRLGHPTRFYYVTQVETSPPTFAFFTNHPTAIRESYVKFLEKTVRREFGFHHIPLEILIRGKRAPK